MKFIRKLVERLSRGKVLQRKIVVANENIRLFVSPDAQLKYLKLGSSAFDRDLIEIAEKHVRENDVVWDVGANVGVFTFASAVMTKSGTVLSIEADNWLAALLRRSAQFNEYSKCKVCIVSAAVSNKNSVASFLIAARGRASNALSEARGRSQMGGVRETVYVPTITLDRLLDSFPKPDFIKIDIEGAELLALEAANEIINNIRPKFYIEVGDDVAAQIFTLFKKAGYSCVEPLTMKVIDQCVENTLFIPGELLTE